MPDTQVTDLFRIRSRFLRSAHLEKDFCDVSALNGYIVTPQIKSSVNRIASGLAVGSGQRAWRITGDYGSGKSIFALALAHLLSGQRQYLPEQLRNIIDYSKLGVLSPRLLPVLVTGSREAMAVAILRSLLHALQNVHYAEKQPYILKRIQSLIQTSAHATVPDTEVIQILQSINDHICKTGKTTGILIILDELGKFLEFAALHPDRQDIYFLQSLAEASARSGNSPMLVVSLLHQGFTTYASELSPVSQREWEKVADRYEELLFNQPLEQTTTIIAEALNIDLNLLPEGLTGQLKSEMTSVINLGWYGIKNFHKALLANAVRLYPLHPAVLPVLAGLFRRFGQNERSLFSFLLSNEPFGLMTFANQPLGSCQYYRIHNLYDYTRANFGHRLNVQGYRSHWSQIESIVESFATEDEIELQVLKTVAMLNLLDANSLLASDIALELAVDGSNTYNKKCVRDAIFRLCKVKRVLYNRGAAGGYYLWPYTSVNLEQKYFDAVRSLGLPQRISSLVQTELENRPLVARRHYIETGNLRHFDVQYAAVSELESFLETNPASADGRILVPLCETEEERITAVEFAKSKVFNDRPNLLVAIPRPLLSLRELVQESGRWEWIAHNVPELNYDSCASEEVSRQISASRQVLQKRIQSFIGLYNFTEKMELQWFCQGKRLNISSNRELLAYLSGVCDDVYNKAPIIQNELVNRRSLSSAAAAARMRLIERMFKHTSEPLLGMDTAKKPPEMSMYLSVLQKSQLHQQTQDGFRIIEPDEEHDPCRLRPALKLILELLENKPYARVRISDIFEELRRPPYGVRDGLHPLLLATFTLIHENDIAFYEDGAFLRHVSGEHFYRITKAPETFEMQWCRIGGIRSILYEQLLSVLGQSLPENQESNVLDVVIPLTTFAAGLPAYTHNTRNLSANAVAVRDALRRAEEPVMLVFADLPKACGFAAFNDESSNLNDIQRFVGTLKDALEELRAAYPELLAKLKATILSAFDLPNIFSKARDTLANDAKRMLVAVKEPRLKAFCLRLMDVNLPETQWLESLGSFLCSKPPSKWTDMDVDLFYTELHGLAHQFRHVQSVIFSNIGASQGTAVRVAVTQQDGTEVAQVVFIDPDEEPLAANIEATISGLIRDSKRVGLAAASRAIWKELSESNGERGNETTQSMR